jgi:tripartite-type tricarboxylate transporter receptor subunit TctC
MTRIAGRILGALALAGACACHAQSYPFKPIRTLLTISGGADIVARLVAQSLSESLGQPMVVEVQSGAGGTIAADVVMRAAPDGHTLLLSSAATQLQLSRNPRIDVARDFTAIAKAVETVLVVVANAALPASSLSELIDLARRSPGKLFFSTSSTGGIHHLSGEQIRLLTGIEWVHVPYKGGTQALMDTITGQVHVNFAALSTAVAHAKSRKVRILGVNNAQRYHVIPDVPTVSEQVPGYQPPPAWLAYFGPAGVPMPVVSRLNAEIIRSMKVPEIRAKAEEIGFVVATGSPAELAESVRRDIALVKRIIDTAGIKLE